VALVAFGLLSGHSPARDEAHLLLASFHGHRIVARCLEASGGGAAAALREVSLRVEHLQDFLADRSHAALARVKRWALGPRISWF
jgi:hypothetical protein